MFNWLNNKIMKLFCKDFKDMEAYYRKLENENIELRRRLNLCEDKNSKINYELRKLVDKIKEGSK